MRSPPRCLRRRFLPALALLYTLTPLARSQGPDGDWVHPALRDAAPGTPAAPPAPAPVGAPPPWLSTPGIDSWNVSLDEGFAWTSADGAIELELGGLMQGGWQWNGPYRSPESEVELRKLRLDFAGRLGETFRFKLSPDFAEERGPIDQAWVGAELGERFATVLFGRSTVPFGLEEVRNRASAELANLSILDQFTPQQQTGLFLNGGGEERLFEWNLAAYDGSDAVNGSSDEGGAARLAVHPFAGSDGWFEHLHLGLSGTYGDVGGSLAGTFVNNAAGLPIMKYADDVRLTGRRTRVGTELAWRHGPWFVQGEWSYVSQDLASDVTTETVGYRGWYLDVSRMLTGETRSYLPTQPRNPLRTRKFGGLGAWSVVLRYSELHSDAGLRDAGFTVPGAYVEDVQSLWFGVNWTPDPHVLLRNSYVHSFYSDDVYLDGEPVSNEGAFLVQLQLSF